jgi:hypothetical protein
MSFSVNYIGTPTKIVEALKKHSEELTGQSKEEFDAALPSIIGIVELNYDNSAGHCMSIKLSAHGHAYSNGGERRSSNCSVNIEAVGSQILF